MKKYLLLSALALPLLMTSCKEDEEKINPIVGLWVLDDIEASDLPSGYAFATNPSTSFTIWGENEYEIEFFSDGFYERELKGTFAGDLEDDGEWELIGDELDLDQDNADTEDVVTKFTVEGEITERSMTLIGTDSWFAWPPEVLNDPNKPLDTLETNEELNAFFAEYGAIVEVTVTMEFDRER